MKKYELYDKFDQEEYMKIWFDLVNKAEKDNFTWPSLLEDDEWNQYMSTSLYKMDKRTWDNIKTATIRVTQIFQKLHDHILEDVSTNILPLQVPYKLHSAISANTGNSLFSYFTRYDFIVNGEDIKLIEANVDTPTGVMESSVANKVVCEAHGVNHPNNIEESIEKAWEMIIDDYKIKEIDTIYFTSYGWHNEDRETTQFLMRHTNHPNKEYIAIENIHVAEDGIYTPEGKRIRYLYRLYPLEFFLDDGELGEKFLQVVADSNVKLINPPSSILIQTKTILAYLWELHEKRSDLFTKKEHLWIRKYFLPTYTNSTPFNQRAESYVAKPIYGREGGGVSIIEKGVVVDEDETDYYVKQNKVYQRYVEMPDQEISTWDGDYKGKLLIGSHVIGGQPAGLFLRVGEKITGNLSMFMGLTVE